MHTKEDIEKAKQYLDNEGYGTGSNFTLNAVANLMAEYAAKNCVIPAVSGSALSPIEWLEKEVKKRFGGETFTSVFSTEFEKAKQMEKALSIADVIAMLPSSESIEANGIEGGLRDGELQLFWEGAEWLKSHLQKRLLSKGN